MADPTAPAPGGQGEAPAGGSGNTPANWIETISDNDLKGWVQNKGFKEPAEVANSYRNLEKLMGADKAGRTVVLPSKWDDPAEVGSFYDKLGRPKDPTGYKLPDGADPDLAKWAPTVFHEAGLTPRQAEIMTAKWQEMVGGKTEALKAQFEAKAAADIAALKTEWGAAYNDKVAKAKTAAKEFGVDEALADKLENALGTAGLLKFFSTIGEKVGEATFVAGDAPANGANMTPAQALAAIGELRKDSEFIARYGRGDAEARQKMERLHKMAYPDG